MLSLLILSAVPAAGFAEEGTLPIEEERVPEEKEGGNGRNAGSMGPIDPEEKGLTSRQGGPEFGVPLDESTAETNTGGSPWGGILFFVAAIALGIGLAIARGKK